MLNTLDLFAGIGGFSLGLEQTGGFRTAAFCEINEPATKVLNKHWPKVPVYGDIADLTKELLDADGITIDCITGGFPCQDISLAGKGAGLAGERSGLWFQFHRLIKEIQPQVVIAENVSALRSRGLEEVLRSLAEVGYDAEWHCIPASAVGAPHRRDRIWIVAYPRHGSRGNLWSLEGGENPQSERSSHTGTPSRPSGEPSDVANTISLGQQGQGEPEQPFNPAPLITREAVDAVYGGIRPEWPVEPNVGRVAHGVPKRVDRLKQLGNAIVPEIARLIGLQVMAKMGEKQYA